MSISVAMMVATQASSYYSIQTAIAQARLPNNSVRTETIANGQVTTADLASGAIQLNIHRVEGENKPVPPNNMVGADAHCPDGQVLTGGGVSSGTGVTVQTSLPLDENTWRVVVLGGEDDNGVTAYALCVDPSIP